MTQPAVHAQTNELWGADWPAIRAAWPLEQDRRHLNHGSYGAAPSVALQAQQAWREQMEANPVRFFRYHLEDAVDEARAAMASFLNADLDGFAFVTNASTGATAVIESIDLRAGDDVVMTNHAYGAVRIAVERACRRAGAHIVTVDIPFELGSAEEITSAIVDRIGPHTRLVVVDHITSPTAALFPLGEIVPAVRAAGVPILVDAAHAPGMLPVDVDGLGVDFWVGNFHKWACSPKGAAGLAVAPEWRDRMRALIVSWNDPEGYPTNYRFLGSADYTAWLAAPVSVRWLGEVGWDRIREHNRRLARYGQQEVAEALGKPLIERPGDDQLSLRLVPLRDDLFSTELEARAFQRTISDELGIETLMTAWNGRALLRLSAHAYNAPSDYDALAAGLPDIVGR